METKKCCRCGGEKPPSEFNKNRSTKDGRQDQCRECDKAYRRANRERIAAQKKEHYQDTREEQRVKREAYRGANREKILEQKRKYREANRKKIAEQARKRYHGNPEKRRKQNRRSYHANREERQAASREYRKANREKLTEWHRKNYQANRERLAEQHKRYYEENRKELLERQRAYREENLEQIAERERRYREENIELINKRRKGYRKTNAVTINAYNAKRRAKKRDSVHPNHDPEIEKRIHRLAKRLERMTGYRWHVDHVVPLSKNGWHHHGNLQVIPAEWNIKKHNDPSWVPSPCPPWFRVPTEEDIACGGVCKHRHPQE